MQVDPTRHANAAQRPKTGAVAPNAAGSAVRPTDPPATGVRGPEALRAGASPFPTLDVGDSTRGRRPLPSPETDGRPPGGARPDPVALPEPGEPGAHHLPESDEETRAAFHEGTNDGAIGARILAARFGEGSPGAFEVGDEDFESAAERRGGSPFGRLFPDDVPPGVREMAEVQAMTGGEFLGRGGRVDLRA